MLTIFKINALLTFINSIATSLNAASEKLDTKLTKLEEAEEAKATKDSDKAKANKAKAAKKLIAKQGKLTAKADKVAAKLAAKNKAIAAKRATAVEAQELKAYKADKKVAEKLLKRATTRTNIKESATKARNASANFNRMFNEVPAEPIELKGKVIDLIED